MSVVMEKLRSFVMLPAYESEEKAREAHLAYLIAITFTIAPFLYGVYRLTAQAGDASAGHGGTCQGPGGGAEGG